MRSTICRLSAGTGILMATAILGCVATAQTAAPAPIGDWRFMIDKGHPVAMARAAKSDADHLAGIRMECGPGGKLEYVPVALRLTAFKTLWVQGMDDVEITIPLVRDRVAGADNALLSKEFLKFDAMAKKDKQPTWSIGMSIDGSEQFVEEIRMGGFGQVREFMLRSCKP